MFTAVNYHVIFTAYLLLHLTLYFADSNFLCFIKYDRKSENLSNGEKFKKLNLENFRNMYVFPNINRHIVIDITDTNYQLKLIIYYL